MPAPNAIASRTEKRDSSPMATRPSGYTPSASASSSRPRCKSRAFRDEAQKTFVAETARPAGRHDVVARGALDDRSRREFGKARKGQPRFSAAPQARSGQWHHRAFQIEQGIAEQKAAIAEDCGRAGGTADNV